LTVDVLIQPNEWVTGIDVKFNPLYAKYALDELERRNIRERRLGTSRELVPVGIIHRHGFETAKPFRSEMDVKSLSDYIHWMGGVTQTVSPIMDSFDNIGKIDAVIEGNILKLAGPTTDHLLLQYDLGSLEAEKNFLRSHGYPSLAGFNGQFRELLRAHLQWLGHIDAVQSQLVSTATSVIYNRDGREKFTEILLLAKGAVNGSFEQSFITDTDMIDTGDSFSMDSLEEEVVRKINWHGKNSFYDNNRLQISPKSSQIKMRSTASGNAADDATGHNRLHTRVIIAKKDSTQTYIDTITGICCALCTYISNAQNPEAKYSLYVYTLLDALSSQKTFSIPDAIRRAGRLYADPIDEGGEFPKPMLDGRILHRIISRVYSTNNFQNQNNSDMELLSKFNSVDIIHINNLLEQYVSTILSDVPQ
jgi:hypothetical protein